MHNDRDDEARNNRAGNGPMNALAPIMTLDQGDYQAAIHDTLRRGFGHHPHPVKRLATVANTNIRTAKNWWNGSCAPGGLHLLRLIASEPVFSAEIRRLTGMRDDLDPELDRDISALVQRYMERRR